MEDYLEMLPAGFTTVESVEDLRRILVEPFAEGQHLEAEGAEERRRHLVDRFEEFTRRLATFGLELEIWIDGSMLTQKPKPGDVDLVVFFEQDAFDALEPSRLDEFSGIFSNRAETKIRYGCDAYCTFRSNSQMLEYWLDMFGSSRENRPKGMVRLRVSP